MILFWILYLIFLFATVILLYSWALNWFYNSFMNNKNKR